MNYLPLSGRLNHTHWVQYVDAPSCTAVQFQGILRAHPELTVNHSLSDCRVMGVSVLLSTALLSKAPEKTEWLREPEQYFYVFH